MSSHFLRTSDLTAGERLVVARRRDDMTQARAADLAGVNRMRYSRWESDVYADQPHVVLGPLALHEQLYILRRRAGISRNEIADEIGCSRSWVTDMEWGRGTTQRLVDYWRDRVARRPQRRS